MIFETYIWTSCVPSYHNTVTEDVTDLIGGITRDNVNGENSHWIPPTDFLLLKKNFKFEQVSNKSSFILQVLSV